MARTADKPGTFRIKDKGGEYLLSGVTPAGKRVKLSLGSRSEADEIAGRLFGKPAQPSSTFGTKTLPTTVDYSKVDDWGIPIRVSDSTVESTNKGLGIGPLPGVGAPNQPTTTPKVDTAEETEKKAKRAKNAKSLMELAGIAGAAGDVFMARKLCERAGKEPVKPNPTQVNDLRDSIKDTLTDMFGDREIAPWQMMILLALGIPMAMLLQSPKKKPEPKPESQPVLKSVP